MKDAFTLLEVLVALSVLAISMLGIYSLMNGSIRMVGYGAEKNYVINKAYERVMLRYYYPRISFGEVAEAGEREVSFTEEREDTEVPGLANIVLRVKTDKAAVSFEFFERR